MKNYLTNFRREISELTTLPLTRIHTKLHQSLISSFSVFLQRQTDTHTHRQTENNIRFTQHSWRADNNDKNSKNYRNNNNYYYCYYNVQEHFILAVKIGQPTQTKEFSIHSVGEAQLERTATHSHKCVGCHVTKVHMATSTK